MLVFTRNLVVILVVHGSVDNDNQTFVRWIKRGSLYRGDGHQSAMVGLI